MLIFCPSSERLIQEPWQQTAVGIYAACASPACSPRGDASGRTVEVSCSAGDTNCIESRVCGVYSTSVADGGRAAPIIEWFEYDPRVRPWYTTAKELWESTSKTLTFSPVYKFTTGDSKVGITATSSIVINGAFAGVHGADFVLNDISKMLRTFTGCNSETGRPCTSEVW